jgi:hypothetical protein
MSLVLPVVQLSTNLDGYRLNSVEDSFFCTDQNMLCKTRPIHPLPSTNEHEIASADDGPDKSWYTLNCYLMEHIQAIVAVNEKLYHGSSNS